MTSDKKRADLAIPYVHSADSERAPPAASMMAQSLPMMAMFMRSKLLGWAGLFIAFQTYLSQSTDRQAEDSLGLSSLMTSIIGVAMSYMDFVYVPQPTPPKTQA